MISAERLISNGYEFFVHNNEIFMIHKGKTTPYIKFTEDVKCMLKNIMVKAAAWKQYNRKFEDPIAEFIKDNFANFDDISDIDESGEAHFERKQHLSKREIEYLKHNLDDLADKQIADRMRISTNTATTYRQRIANKLGIVSKVGLAVWTINTGNYA